MVDIELPEVKYVMLTDATTAQAMSFVTTTSLLVRPNERMPPASVRNGLCFGPSHVAKVRFDVDSRAVGCLINSPCPTSLATTRDQLGAEVILRAKWPCARSEPRSWNIVVRAADTSSPASAISVLQHDVARSTLRRPTPFVQERFEPHALVVVAVSATES